VTTGGAFLVSKAKRENLFFFLNASLSLGAEGSVKKKMIDLVLSHHFQSGIVLLYQIIFFLEGFFRGEYPAVSRIIIKSFSA
jgi:hypothetical protein